MIRVTTATVCRWGENYDQGTFAIAIRSGLWLNRRTFCVSQCKHVKLKLRCRRYGINGIDDYTDMHVDVTKSAARRLFVAGSPSCCVTVVWWRLELTVLGCRADILGANCDQCVCMVQCCFTSTETIRVIRTGSPGRLPRLSHSSCRNSVTVVPTWTVPLSLLPNWAGLT